MIGVWELAYVLTIEDEMSACYPELNVGSDIRGVKPVFAEEYKGEAVCLVGPRQEVGDPADRVRIPGALSRRLPPFMSHGDQQ